MPSKGDAGFVVERLTVHTSYSVPPFPQPLAEAEESSSYRLQATPTLLEFSFLLSYLSLGKV